MSRSGPPAKLVLASASPRRAALLRQAGIPFTVAGGELSEKPCSGVASSPGETVCRLALAKARAAARRQPGGALILGADTLVFCRGQILGKPRDEVDARRMLTRLGGGVHSVLTGLALLEAATGREMSEWEETRVWMRSLEAELIEAYIATGEPMDKAGAYGIQGKAALFIEKIEGCYFNVVGLPLSRLYFLLSRMGIKPWHGWRDSFDAGRTVDDQGPAP